MVKYKWGASVYQVYCAAVYRERRYQMLCEYNFSSWRWACYCSKHVEDNSVAYILLMNKENCALKLVAEIILYYDARSKKHQITTTLFWFRKVPTCFRLRAHHQGHHYILGRNMLSFFLIFSPCIFLSFFITIVSLTPTHALILSYTKIT